MAVIYLFFFLLVTISDSYGVFMCVYVKKGRKKLFPLLFIVISIIIQFLFFSFAFHISFVFIIVSKLLFRASYFYMVSCQDHLSFQLDALCCLIPLNAKKKRRYKIWAEEQKKHTLTHTIAVNQEDRAPSSVLRELCL